MSCSVVVLFDHRSGRSEKFQTVVAVGVLFIGVAVNVKFTL